MRKETVAAKRPAAAKTSRVVRAPVGTDARTIEDAMAKPDSTIAGYIHEVSPDYRHRVVKLIPPNATLAGAWAPLAQIAVLVDGDNPPVYGLAVSVGGPIEPGLFTIKRVAYTAL